MYQKIIANIKENPIRCLLYYTAFTILVFSLITANPLDTITAMGRILTTPDGLITDYMGVGSMSAAFLNASLVTLLSLFLLDYIKITYNGSTISAVFLMTGFALFGKNILNILPIFLGVYIYAKVQKDAFRKYIYIALLGSSLAPMVSEVSLNFGRSPATLQSISTGILVGAVAGFLLPALSVDGLRIHQGFNLYNVGFAAGLIGVLFASFSSTFGFANNVRLVWTEGQNPILYIFLYFLFISFIVFGYILNGKSFSGYVKIFRHSGRAVADFTILDSKAIAFINMGVVGSFALTYMIVMGGDINGPTIGAILTVVGFGAMGKHLKNMIPPMLGVVIMSLIASWSLNTPAIQLAMLFCTALAPFAGQYGIGYGVLAGAMHSAIVLCVTSLHGGLNLYNNGFAAGLVAMILLPTITALAKEKES